MAAIKVNGGYEEEIEVRVDDEPAPIITATDPTWTAGQAGVRMYANDKDRANASFDNVRMVPLPG